MTAHSPLSAARKLGVSRAAVYGWILQGLLPAHRYGPRLLRIRGEDLERFICQARITNGASNDSEAASQSSQLSPESAIAMRLRAAELRTRKEKRQPLLASYPPDGT